MGFMKPILTRPFSFRQEKGLAAVLVPGGALEALNSDEDKIRLVLNRRKGFIKLALRFGVNLVPTFSFGENFIYDQVKAEQGKEKLYLILQFFDFSELQKNSRVDHNEKSKLSSELCFTILFFTFKKKI